MKNFLFIIPLMMSALLTGAQDSWKICLNKKKVLASNESNEALNIRNISQSEWLKNGYLEVTYKEITPSTLLHSLQFTDEQGMQLFNKDSTTTAKIPIAELRKLYGGKKELKIYMVLNPPNPMMMMPSRMIHLATLRLPLAGK